VKKYLNKLLLTKVIMETKKILTLKPRRITAISGSLYVALPIDWINHHNLRKRNTVQVSIDSESRLIIEPLRDYND